jgi:hypothetical protein
VSGGVAKPVLGGRECGVGGGRDLRWEKEKEDRERRMERQVLKAKRTK